MTMTVSVNGCWFVGDDADGINITNILALRQYYNSVYVDVGAIRVRRGYIG